MAIILKESQRQKQEKDVNGQQLYSELESMKVENAKLTKSIDDLKNDNKDLKNDNKAR